MRVSPEVSWWWKPFRKPKGFLQLQLGVFVDWEPPHFTIGLDIIIIKVGLKFDWSREESEG